MATTTFIWYPDNESQEDVKPNVVVTKFGDGYENRVPLGINTQPMTWNLVFTRGQTEAMLIRDFLRARGASEAFNWTTPDSETGVYVCRSWNGVRLGGGVRKISCSFEQVYEP